MQKIPLGPKGPQVSRLCLGSMTWGGPTPLPDAHHQIEIALDHGINFIDTAEIYPVTPVRAETVGRTERIIGLWLEQNMRRGDVILSTKLCGVGQKVVRGGAPVTPETIRTGLEGALRRMKTDYIDLYQFHWPNRGSYHDHRAVPWTPSGRNLAQVRQNMADCLGAIQDEQSRGTIRFFGLSNETAWGTMQWLDLAEQGIGPRPVSIQNEYSLLCRRHDTDLAEVCVNEGIGLLGFAPRAAGLLTGKYQGHAKPSESRMALATDLGGRRTARAMAAVDDYLDVAFKHNLDAIGMAIAFALSRPFTTSVVFGATTEEQLKRFLDLADLELDDEVIADIETVHRAHPMPF